MSRALTQWLAGPAVLTLYKGLMVLEECLPSWLYKICIIPNCILKLAFIHTGKCSPHSWAKRFSFAANGDYCWKAQLVKKIKWVDHEVPSPNGYTHTTSHPFTHTNTLIMFVKIIMKEMSVKQIRCRMHVRRWDGSREARNDIILF